jgi:UDP-N-acetylglucosamine 2-epimerase (non-hydrolysing)
MIHVVYGTRAELIKLSPVIRELKKRKLQFETVDLGQHDTEDLRKSLGMPKPHHSLGESYRDRWSRLESRIVTYPAAAALALAWGAKNFPRLVDIFSGSDLVVVHGNTMGVPLSIFAAKISGRGARKPKIMHVESGLRAGTKSSVLLDMFYNIAEKNSDILVTTSKVANRTLGSSGKKVVHVGNFMKEIVDHATSKRPSFKIRDKKYVLVNSSRSIYSKSSAASLVNVMKTSGLKFYFIVNPVIKNRLRNYGMMKILRGSKNIVLLDPINHVDFIHALKNSLCVITDSNGVEEECAVMKKPCIVTNDFIQLPEIVDGGIAKVTGCDFLKISHELDMIKKGQGLYRTASRSKMVLSDGKATKRIVDFLEGMM